MQTEWQCQPRAENLILNLLAECCRGNAMLQKLEHDLFTMTSTRLMDWVDHLIVGSNSDVETEMTQSGYEPLHAGASYRLYHHPGAQLPRLLVKDYGQAVMGVGVSVDYIEDFLMIRGMSGEIEGSLYSAFRRCCVSIENGIGFWVIERRGTDRIEPVYQDKSYLARYLKCQEKWQTRPRSIENEDEAMMRTLLTAQEIIADLNLDIAAALILEVERAYWQAKNLAGQIQKNRQDRLGMGWANHDHHTFRSSRAHFHQLVRLFEMLGFHCRERYYAGQEAGWGAQIMENPRSRYTLFLDVDLAPDEITIDFAHQPLKPLDYLGTIGLWCGLHGDSILRGGMHHLEAQFMFDDLTKDLGGKGVGMMDPFSNFPYLKQAFTVGERWSVEPWRVEKLLKQGLITQEQADQFLHQGAVGSHMENLQRREGYKGFNQKNVSFIIKKTDPRLAQE